MGIRAQHRETTERAILDAGLRLLAAGGLEAITIRGVARDLDLAPSALYRYVADRDALLTLLIAHCHGDLAEAVQSAHDAVANTTTPTTTSSSSTTTSSSSSSTEPSGSGHPGPPAPLAEPSDSTLRARWHAIAHAIRDWSVAHPHEFALIFGTPVRGYHAPPERTVDPGTRVLRLLAALGADAEATHLLAQREPAFEDKAATAVPKVVADLEAGGLTMTPAAALTGLAAWHLVMGATTSEIFGHLGADTVSGDDYFAGIALTGEYLIFGPPDAR